MGCTRHIFCMDCKVELWYGQTDYIYDDKDGKKLPQFLIDHQGHNLKAAGSYYQDGTDEFYGFTDYKPEPKESQ